MDSLSKKPAQRTLPQPPRPSIPTQARQRETEPARKRIFPEKPLPKKQKKHPFLKIILLIAFAFLIALGGYFTFKLYRVGKTIRIAPQQHEASTSTLGNIQSIATSIITATPKALKGEETGRINILLLGRAGEHHPGHDLTDTIMIMSIDMKTKRIALLSLPRDLYVRIPDSDSFTKINAVYQHGLNQETSDGSKNKGIDFIERTVENITKQPIHYAIIIDFDGFEKVINAIGGVNVEVMRDIYDSRYPGPNYSYETFEIKKGWQELDGATALKYVRERHDDPEGDFGRAKRQQQVIQAAKNKAFSLKTFIDVFALNDLLTILGDSIRTTISAEEIPSFIALSKQVDTNNIENVVVDAWKPDSLLRVSHVMVGPTRMFTLVPRTGNYGEIQDIAANIFDLSAIKRRTDAIAAENPSITIVNRSSNPRLAMRVKKLLQDSPGFSESDIRMSTEDSRTSPQDESFVIDRTSRQKPFGLDELLKKLPLTLRDSADFPDVNSSSDFVLVLGNTFGDDMDFEEDSVDDFKKSENDNIAYPSDMLP